MKKISCTIFWTGQSKSGNNYIGVKFVEDGFVSKAFVGVTEEKLASLEVGQEINIPVSAL